MAYIKKKSERKFKITVCNGYKVNGQKRMKAQTITVPSSVPKRGIQQYVMAEAERIEKKFKYGVEESDQTHFEQYAENWLTSFDLFISFCISALFCVSALFFSSLSSQMLRIYV